MCVNVVWVLSHATKAEIEKTLQTLNGIPFKPRLIIVNKSEDIYTEAFVGTFGHKLVEKTIVINMPKDSSLYDCLAVSTDFIGEVSLMYTIIDGYSVDVQLIQSSASAFMKNTEHDIFIFKEKVGDKEIFDASGAQFTSAGFFISRKPLTRYLKSSELRIRTIAQGSIERLTKAERGPIIDPSLFNYRS